MMAANPSMPELKKRKKMSIKDAAADNNTDPPLIGQIKAAFDLEGSDYKPIYLNLRADILRYMKSQGILVKLGHNEKWKDVIAFAIAHSTFDTTRSRLFQSSSRARSDIVRVQRNLDLLSELCMDVAKKEHERLAKVEKALKCKGKTTTPRLLSSPIKKMGGSLAETVNNSGRKRRCDCKYYLIVMFDVVLLVRLTLSSAF